MPAIECGWTRLGASTLRGVFDMFSATAQIMAREARALPHLNFACSLNPDSHQRWTTPVAVNLPDGSNRVSASDRRPRRSRGRDAPSDQPPRLHGDAGVAPSGRQPKRNHERAIPSSLESKTKGPMARERWSRRQPVAAAGSPAGPQRLRRAAACPAAGPVAPPSRCGPDVQQCSLRAKAGLRQS